MRRLKSEKQRAPAVLSTPRGQEGAHHCGGRERAAGDNPPLSGACLAPPMGLVSVMYQPQLLLPSLLLSPLTSFANSFSWTH